MSPEHRFVESQLPEDWVPDGAPIWAIAHRHHEQESWEVLLPEYTIASSAGSLEEAVVSAMELLDDYLLLCFHEGKSFAGSARPISKTWRLQLVAHALRAFVRSKIDRDDTWKPDGGRHRLWRLPLHGVPAH